MSIRRRQSRNWRNGLGAKPLVIQIPLGSEDGFRGVIDLVEMKALDWGNDLLGSTYEVKEILGRVPGRSGD